MKGKKVAKKWRLECKLLHLNDLLSPEDMQRTKDDGTIETGIAEDAYVLVVRGFVDAIMARVQKSNWDLFKESILSINILFIILINISISLLLVLIFYIYIFNNN